MFIGKTLDHEFGRRRRVLQIADPQAELQRCFGRRSLEDLVGNGVEDASAGMGQVAVEGRCEAAAQGQTDLPLPVLHQ
ncbi:hypothetical protein [Streptomyces cyaneofuscatus]|uniref:hypothetical protein n=1 Tax=Streptomyces cyaneofuscatus TaxID=66883 RepID=UPI0033AC7428